MSSRSAVARRTTTTPTLSCTPVARGILQRKCDCGQHTVAGHHCDECSRNRLSLQRATAHPSSFIPHASEAPSIVHDVLRSPGRPLDAATRLFFEPRFGYDFSHVRVHTDAQAAKSARAVRARAYTVGHDIVFNRGEYVPGTSSGNRALAHELAHVVQQSANPAAAPSGQMLRVGESGDRFEKEAEAVSDAVVSGKSAPVQGAAPNAALQRQAGGTPAPATPRDTHTQTGPSKDLTSPLTHSTSNYGLGVFESELRSFGQGSPCMITLRMNLFFDFVDKPRPNPPTRTQWSTTEQNNWIQAFVQAVTSRWSYRYPLVVTTPDCLWATNICTQAMARVEVIPVPQSGNPDATITVAHVPASAYRSNAGYGGANLTQEDVNAGAHIGDQVTVEHEFGHLLGLDHSNPACQSTDAARFDPAKTGAENCYGVTPEQVSDIMGAGSIVTPQDYRPFVQEMNYYTTPCTWKAEGSPPKQKGKAFRHYGLVIGGILGMVGGGILGGYLGSQGSLGTGAGAFAGAALGGLAGAGVGSLLDWATE